MKLPSIQSLLKKHGIRPKKNLGQNFLIAQPTMTKIVDALHAIASDTVLEIGCGLGLMTAMLSERCKHIVAIDADRAALAVAHEEFGAIKNIEWIYGDVLETDISSLARRGKLLIIGNIPYNISSPIFFHLVKHRRHIKHAVFMIQKEVADRVTAAPGGKDYGALSIMLQSYAKCEKLFNVAPTNFIPQPEVMSSVIKLDFSLSSRAKSPARRRFSGGRDPLPFDDLRSVVQAAFQKRRKTIKNALSRFDDIEKILADFGIDPKRRPETLSVKEFQELAQKIAVSPTRE